MAVPFLDLYISNSIVEHDVLDDVSGLLRSGAFTNGPSVEQFETAFAAYCGVEHCVGVGSGLDALRFALVAGGLEAGDEVLVPAMTFIASFEAVSQAGGIPVPVDVSPLDFCIDPEAAAAAIGPKTRFILPVHLYGRLSSMERLSAVAQRQGLSIVEDACQAHGASRAGIGSGHLSTGAAFSFYPGKNLGAMGDAGAFATNDERLADDIRALREHGQRRKYHHDAIGWTSRLDTVQAAFLLRKLPHLDRWNDERRIAARHYNEALSGIGDLRLPDPGDNGQVWHLYVVRTADPQGLAASLAAEGIGTGHHYPEPPHLSAAYSALGYREGSFPEAESIGRTAISLPIFPGITEAQLDEVASAVRQWFEHG